MTSRFAPLLLAALVGASCRSPEASVALRSQLTDSLRADDGTSMVVRRGRVRVPERHSDPSGPELELAVVRIEPAGAAGPPHYFLAGGPGASGVDLAIDLARHGGAPLFALLGGPLVGIDQRGTGASQPNLATPVKYPLPLDQPASLELWLPIMARTCRTVATSLTARGIDLAAYNTRESADDVELVRRAFGDARIVLWGRSYGSHLALAVARQHPAGLARLVLVNPEGPDHTFKSPLAVEAVVRRLSELVATDPQLGARVPDLYSVMARVLADLRRAPVVVDVGAERVTLGAFDVQWLTAQALGDPRRLATLPAAYLEMAAGDYRRVALVARMARQRLGVESAMKQVMDTSSGASPERRAQIEREAASALLGNTINFPTMYLGEAWGAPDLGDAFRQPVTSDVPTLVLVGDLDPRTPVDNGREVVSHLANGHLVIVRNGGHTFDLFNTTALRALLGDFLAGRPITTETITLPPPRFFMD